MNKLASILIAAFAFWIITVFLVPMLPEPIKSVALVVVVLSAVVFLLSLFTSYNFRWFK